MPLVFCCHILSSTCAHACQCHAALADRPSILTDHLAVCRLLLLVHEPEAASIAVLKTAQNPIAISEGNQVVTLDAGGGTVDITYHKVCAHPTSPVKPCALTMPNFQLTQSSCSPVHQFCGDSALHSAQCSVIHCTTADLFSHLLVATQVLFD